VIFDPLARRRKRLRDCRRVLAAALRHVGSSADAPAEEHGDLAEQLACRELLRHHRA